MTDPVVIHPEPAPSQKRPLPWRWPILRPGRSARRSGAACDVRIHRFAPWLRATRKQNARGADTFGVVEVVMAAAAERGATLRPTKRDVIAVLRRLRNRYPPVIARTIAVDARAARGVLRHLKPAMVRRATGVWQLNPFVVRARSC